MNCVNWLVRERAAQAVVRKVLNLKSGIVATKRFDETVLS